MKKPSVCFVSMPIYPLLADSEASRFCGGAELQQLLIGRELAARGYPVSYVTLDHGQTTGNTLLNNRVPAASAKAPTCEGGERIRETFECRDCVVRLLDCFREFRLRSRSLGHQPDEPSNGRCSIPNLMNEDLRDRSNSCEPTVVDETTLHGFACGV